MCKICFGCRYSYISRSLCKTTSFPGPLINEIEFQEFSRNSRSGANPVIVSKKFLKNVSKDVVGFRLRGSSLGLGLEGHANSISPALYLDLFFPVLYSISDAM